MIIAADLFQWTGFLLVIGGYACFGNNNRAGAGLTVLGAGLLAAWCLVQPEIPLGVLCVQVAACIINAYKAVQS